MHNALLTAAGEKMSKSLGNGALVSEVVQRFPARAVRFYLLQPHYRSTIEYSDAAIAEAAAGLARIDNFVARAGEMVGTAPGARGVPPGIGTVPSSVPEAFVAAMNDDLGTPAAVAVLQGAVRDGNVALDAADHDQLADRLGEVNGMMMIFGLDAGNPAWSRVKDDHDLTTVVDGLVGALLAQRDVARARKDFAAADAIRDSLAELGVEISDTSAGPRWTLR